MEEIRSKVHTCLHCGNTGMLKYIGKTRWEDKSIEYDVEGEAIEYLIEHQDYFVFECPVCNKPVIISEYVIDVANSWAEIKTEYPEVLASSEGVPKQIYTTFESAVKTKGIDNAICLLSLRRVLEMICKDKGAKGRTLEKKIEYLIQNNSLPPMIEDACWIIRQLGNDAAHADDSTVSSYDIEQVIGFVSTIIDYLYSLPLRVSNMKNRIIARKAKKK